MFPPIFKALAASKAITDLVKNGNVARIYDFGRAPQGVEYPYLTFYQVSGRPHENISDAPSADTDVVRVDIWAQSPEHVTTLAKAAQAVFDDNRQSNKLVMQTIDDETGSYRVCIEVEWLHSRH